MNDLFLAGDYMKVPSVNGALASGVEAADAVAEMLASGSRQGGFRDRPFLFRKEETAWRLRSAAAA